MVANLDDSSLATALRAANLWTKGLLRCGCDVQTFNYRQAVSHKGRLRHRILKRVILKNRIVETLESELRSYRPDVVLLPRDRVKDLDGAVLDAMRRAAPEAAFAAIAQDWLPELDPVRLSICPHLDYVLVTSAGDFLRTYKKAGVKTCAFLPNACDPDLQYRYEVDSRWTSDIMFAGRTSNPKLPPNPERQELLERLAGMPNVKLYACFDRPRVEGLDACRAISGARIALSINLINTVRLYHSNRLTNNVACGTFTLARRVPDTELLFRDQEHLRYFETVDEFFDLAQWYLQHEDERERIARTGMEYTHREFNCQRMAQHLLDLIETGRIDAPWAEII